MSEAGVSAVPRAGPRNMRVFDPTTSSLTISWEHAEGPVRQYKISYSPLTGAPNSRVEIVSNQTNEASFTPSFTGDGAFGFNPFRRCSLLRKDVINVAESELMKGLSWTHANGETTNC